MRIVELAGTWTLQVLLGALFMVLGAAKFGDPSWARKFADWGYPDGFYMAVGVLEIAAGLMVLVPRVASSGALVIVTVMVGAALTHLVHAETHRLSGPLMFLAIAAAVGLAATRVRSAAGANAGAQAGGDITSRRGVAAHSPCLHGPGPALRRPGPDRLRVCGSPAAVVARHDGGAHAVVPLGRS